MKSLLSLAETGFKHANENDSDTDEEFMGNKSFNLRRLVIIGECLLGTSDVSLNASERSEAVLSARPVVYREQVKLLTSVPQTSPFVMLLNLASDIRTDVNPQIIKILRLPQPDPLQNNQITCVHFGPYDNGYIALGTSSGHLILLDPLNLRRINSDRLFDLPISSIRSEPTQILLVGSVSGRFKALNIVK